MWVWVWACALVWVWMRVRSCVRARARASVHAPLAFAAAAVFNESRGSETPLLGDVPLPCVDSCPATSSSASPTASSIVIRICTRDETPFSGATIGFAVCEGGSPSLQGSVRKKKKSWRVQLDFVA